MKLFWILPAALLLARGAAAQSDPWEALRVFEGRWRGPTSGKPGTGATVREFRFVLSGHFLSQRDSSSYRSPDSGRRLVHEDRGYFSYDAQAKKLLWRQFHSEGYVNEYELESVSGDGKSIQFLTTRIENLPGFRARKVYRVLSPDAIDETFWLAPPGQDFAVYTIAHLHRVR